MGRMTKRIKDVEGTGASSKLKSARKTKSVERRLHKEKDKGCIFVKNVPFKILQRKIKKHFSKFGNIAQMKLNKRDGELCDYFIEYSEKEDARSAIDHFSQNTFMGKNIEVDWTASDSNSLSTEKTKAHEVNENYGHRNNISNNAAERTSENEKMIHGKSGINKRGRIIVRNLSFKTTPELLQKHFGVYGDITEVNLLKRPDGRLVGCGFIQFEKKQSAIRAILERSGKNFLGRTIVCDWAVPKNKYTVQINNDLNVGGGKDDDDDDDDDKEEEEGGGGKEEEEEEEEESEIVIKEEPLSEEDSESEVSVKEEMSGLSDEDQESVKSEVSDDFSESEPEEKFSPEEIQPQKTPLKTPNDVQEGCTVFVKNVPFSATKYDLKKCFEEFGAVQYALICIDPLTEHSRGTAFVKFENKEDADRCLDANAEIVLQDEVLDVLRALPREAIKNKNEMKKEKKKVDKRHLYLVREGVIIAGSPASEGVSVADMEKRLKLEQWKTQMLRNLNMFVSNTRLVVYNVPLSWNDKQVRELFLKNAGPGAVIKEARIMRDMKNMSADGIGKSKEYAFVHFTQQEHALSALRNINNNPNIFTKSKRPIVTFSIENKAIHKIREKRIEKSKLRNAELLIKAKKIEAKLAAVRAKQKFQDQKNVDNYSGVKAVVGSKKLWSKHHLKMQSALHAQNVQKSKHIEKRKKLANQKMAARTKSRTFQGKQKHREEHDSFSKLVDKYKSKLTPLQSKKKWYE